MLIEVHWVGVGADRGVWVGVSADRGVWVGVGADRGVWVGVGGDRGVWVGEQLYIGSTQLLPTPLQIVFKFPYIKDPNVTMLYAHFHFQRHFGS